MKPTASPQGSPHFSADVLRRLDAEGWWLNRLALVFVILGGLGVASSAGPYLQWLRRWGHGRVAEHLLNVAAVTLGMLSTGALSGTWLFRETVERTYGVGLRDQVERHVAGAGLLLVPVVAAVLATLDRAESGGVLLACLGSVGVSRYLVASRLVGRLRTEALVGLSRRPSQAAA